MRMPATIAGVMLLLVAGVGGCADQPAEAPDDESGDRPTTAQALAYVAAEHAGTPDTASEEDDAAEEFTRGAVGTELRYGSDGEYDGDVLVVAVGKRLDRSQLTCDTETAGLDGCDVTDRGTILWEAETPEEDPGVVYVVVDKGDTSVLLFYAGPAITRDPRDLDLPISTDVLFAIAHDARVDSTTSADAVAGGTDLPFWNS